jgi:hypothetical protein
MPELDRRGVLGLFALAIATPARAEDAGSEGFEVLDWKLDGGGDLARRAVVLVPRGLGAGQRVPVLVLLHGLGETSSEALGVRAWIDRYGLLTSHARLARPPVGPESGRGDLTETRAHEINDAHVPSTGAWSSSVLTRRTFGKGPIHPARSTDSAFSSPRFFCRRCARGRRQNHPPRERESMGARSEGSWVSRSFSVIRRCSARGAVFRRRFEKRRRPGGPIGSRAR